MAAFDDTPFPELGPRPPSNAQLRVALKWLTGATIVLYLMVGGVAVNGWLQAHSTNQALCTFRDDLVHRVQAGDKFLHDHPRGALGLSATDIKTSIANQKRTITALKGLDCS